MDELLDKYAEKFGENFPIYAMMGESENEIMEIVQRGLDEGKPFNPKINKNAYY